MIEIWNQFIYQPLFNLLIFLSKLMFNNLGLGIVALTVLVRLVSIPLTLPTIRFSQKMQHLRPQMEELKKKYGSDKKKMMEEQARLYREHGLNPLAGCLPNLIQFILIIALYNAFISSLKVSTLNTHFLIWDLTAPDKFYMLPLLAGLTQLVYSKMLLPDQPPKVEESASKEKESVEDIAQSMQKQFFLLFPIMTVAIAWGLPSGLGLYWVLATILMIIQQYFVTGWGGLAAWLKIIKR